MRLQPKPARLLAMLLEARGEMVERDDIHEALWPDTNVDFAAGLNTCVRQIRAGLTETGGEAEWIETLPKRGYRVAVEVHGPRTRPETAGFGTGVTAPGATAASGDPHAAGFDLGRGAIPYIATLLLLALGAAVVLWNELFVAPAPSVPSVASDPSVETPRGAAASPETDRPAAAPLRLAVLPFVDPEADDPGSFNRSLTEAYVTALVAAASGEIVVIGPATTAPLLAQDDTLPEVAAGVEADFVLHGGHRASDSMFFVEVVEPDGAHLFARRFELSADAPAEAPEELIADIVAAILEARPR